MVSVEKRMIKNVLTRTDMATNEILTKLKGEGNTLFQANDFHAALVKYDEAIELDPSNCAVLSNRSNSYRYIFCFLVLNFDFGRSACLIELRLWSRAVQDARSVIRFNSEWYKGYFRLGSALLKQVWKLLPARIFLVAK